MTISEHANLKGLAAAVIGQAIKDLTSRNQAKQFYAALFFTDEFSFSFWADCLDIYPEGWKLLSNGAELLSRKKGQNAKRPNKSLRLPQTI